MTICVASRASSSTIVSCAKTMRRALSRRDVHGASAPGNPAKTPPSAQPSTVNAADEAAAACITEILAYDPRGKGAMPTHVDSLNALDRKAMSAGYVARVDAMRLELEKQQDAQRLIERAKTDADKTAAYERAKSIGLRTSAAQQLARDLKRAPITEADDTSSVFRAPRPVRAVPSFARVRPAGGAAPSPVFDAETKLLREEVDRLKHDNTELKAELVALKLQLSANAGASGTTEGGRTFGSEPTYQRFLDMLQKKLPEAVVHHAMVRAGLPKEVTLDDMKDFKAGNVIQPPWPASIVPPNAETKTATVRVLRPADKRGVEWRSMFLAETSDKRSSGLWGNRAAATGVDLPMRQELAALFSVDHGDDKPDDKPQPVLKGQRKAVAVFSNPSQQREMEIKMRRFKGKVNRVDDCDKLKRALTTLQPDENYEDITVFDDPSVEEVKSVSEDGKPLEIDNSEAALVWRYYDCLLKIDGWKVKLKVLRFKVTLDDELFEIPKLIDPIRPVCNQLMSDAELRNFMQFTLPLLNVLQAGAGKPQAEAILVSDVKKLGQIKQMKKSNKSFLEFVVEHLYETPEKRRNLERTMLSSSLLSTLDSLKDLKMSEVVTRMEAVEAGVKSCEADARSMENSKSDDNKEFAVATLKFLEEKNPAIQSTRGKVDDASLAMKELYAYFAEPETRLRLFADLHDMLVAVQGIVNSMNDAHSRELSRAAFKKPTKSAAKLSGGP